MEEVLENGVKVRSYVRHQETDIRLKLFRSGLLAVDVTCLYIVMSNGRLQ